ncbi:MAG: hypothetical protein ACFE8E_12620 [Candidatus Hodarchaeota archaeon]
MNFVILLFISSNTFSDNSSGIYLKEKSSNEGRIF